MKRSLSLLIAILMLLTCSVTALADDIPFKDVDSTKWYYNDVRAAYGLGLINGKNSADTFLPDDSMTYAEAIKLAACMHQLYTDGKITLTNGEPWYQSYLDYCKANGIVTEELPYGELATRAGYMEIFAKALPDGALVQKNVVPEGFIPDVDAGDEYAEAVYKLYRAGIVAGVDSNHSCQPESNIKRSEVAAILSRMMDKSKRVSFGTSAAESELDLQGKTLRVAVFNKGLELCPPQIYLNKGDVIADATALRNKKVSEKLNVTIEPVVYDGIVEFSDGISKSVLSGENKFDLILGHTLTMGGLAQSGIFVNWYDVPYVDFSRPWWSDSNRNDLTYDGVCLLAISDMCTFSITSTPVIVFNKELAKQYGVEDLYEKVLKGEWTYDVMYTVIKDIYKDHDVSETRSANDVYGGAFAIDRTTDAWMLGFDNRTVSVGSNGELVISVKSPSIQDIVSKVTELYTSLKGVATAKNVEDFNALSSFKQGKALISALPLSDISEGRISQLGDGFGVLPYPKLNAEQSGYYSSISDISTCLAVPRTATDLETVGICVEALSAESAVTVKPAIYESVYGHPLAEDSPDKQMLDIITGSYIYDLGYVYDNYTSFAFTLSTIVRSSRSFDEFYQSRYPTARLNIKKAQKTFLKVK